MALVLLLCLPLSLISAGASPVDGYTSALEDLSSCEGFTQAKYPPINSKEYATIKVIHVAESMNKDLFLYTYQPSAESIPLVASKVSIGTTNTGEPGSYDLYDLILLSQDGVFQKYLVRDFLVSDAETRYYDIPAIYRPFDPTLDAAPTDDNTVGGIGIEVGYMYTMIGSDGSYEVSRENVITVTATHAGFVRYGEDYYFFAKGKDCHYIAFDTDKEIDELISADIVYETISVRKVTCLSHEYLNEYEETRQPHDKTLVHDEIFVKTGLFSETGFDRIQTVDSFLAENQDVKEESGDSFKGLKWVLRFEETNYDEYTRYVDEPIPGTLTSLTVKKDVENYIRVENVSILRLSFLDNDILYNMGVVSNIVSGDDNPDNPDPGVPEWFITLLIVLVVLALLLLLWILSIFAPVLKPVLSALVWILLLPFKLLWWLIKALWGWIQKE